MRKIVTLAALILPGAAMAHPGHQTAGLVAGLSHPLSGADHALAMIAVGLLASQLGARAIWAAPLAFVASMLAGSALGHIGPALSGVEPMILASVILLGAAVALARPLPFVSVLAMLAVFGLAHGAAHGAEGPAAGLLPYAAGFAAATVALHGLGAGLGLALARLPGAQRALGGMTMMAGVALALAG